MEVKGSELQSKTQPNLNRPTRKFMRLRCKFRPLHDEYVTPEGILIKDGDVKFICKDGIVGAHKVILCSTSSFFVKIFTDQQGGEMTTVIIPDIKVSTMENIIKLAYNESINLNMSQIQELDKFLRVFDLNWDQFSYCELPTEMKIILDPPLTPLTPSKTTSHVPKLDPIAVSRPSQNFISQFVSIMPKMAPAQQNIVKPKITIIGESTLTKILNPLSNHDSSITRNQNVNVPETTFGSSKKETISLKPKTSVIPPAPYRFNFQESIGEENKLATNLAPSVINSMINTVELRSAVPGQLQKKPEEEIEEIPGDSEESQKLIKEWMESCGKRSQKFDDQPPFLKKIKLNATEVQSTTSNPETADPLKQNFGSMSRESRQEKYCLKLCPVCTATFTFDEDEKHKWHILHHVGMGYFKCNFCDELLKTESAVIIHEKNKHNSEFPEWFNPEQVEREKLREHRVAPNMEQPLRITSLHPKKKKRFLYGMQRKSPGHGRLKNILKEAEDPSASIWAKERNDNNSIPANTHFASSNSKLLTPKEICQNPQIKEAKLSQEDREELMNMRKNNMQLSWLYVCMRCENASGTPTKAINHYRKCYKGQEIPFEDSIIKYVQGFFGKKHCPLCPKRYVVNSGFTTHANHVHPELRAAFTHTVSDDKINCVGCRKKFDDASEFFIHYSEKGCTFSSLGGPVPDNPPKRDYKVYSGRRPMPARFKKKDDEGEEIGEAKRSTRLQNIMLRNEAEDKFLPVDCPLCGDQEVTNFMGHLKELHGDLNIYVERKSDSAVTCKTCGITFAIIDLLGHSKSCVAARPSTSQDGKKRRVDNFNLTQRYCPKTPDTIVNVEDLPEGVGRSSIEKFDIDPNILISYDVFKKTLTCPVCHKKGKKTGFVSACLRSHGVFRCALCFNTYVSKEDYSAHLKILHSDPNFPQRLACIVPTCTATFANVGQAAGHMFKVHWARMTREMAQISFEKNREKRIEGRKRAKMERLGLTIPQQLEPFEDENVDQSNEGSDEDVDPIDEGNSPINTFDEDSNNEKTSEYSFSIPDDDLSVE